MSAMDEAMMLQAQSKEMLPETSQAAELAKDMVNRAQEMIMSHQGANRSSHLDDAISSLERAKSALEDCQLYVSEAEAKVDEAVASLMH